MADPVRKPLVWSKSYPAYAEKHDMYRVLQELLKELIITKPPDPLAFIRDELPEVARLLYSPRVFLVGPNIVTQGLGRNLATKCGSKFLTFEDIIDSSPPSIRNVLIACVKDPDKRYDDSIKKLLISTVKLRLSKPDCRKNGYILFGFPQNKLQAKSAQQGGLLPREVYVLLPDPKSGPSESKLKIDEKTEDGPFSLPDMTFSQLQDVSEAYDGNFCKTIPYDKWGASKKQDIEAEFLADFVSVKPCGSPWIPKVLIVGPPSSGRSTMAEELSRKYLFVNVDFMELMRGAATLNDEVGNGCKKSLEEMEPMSEELTKRLLKRRLTKTDCERKGWILHGFPQTAKQLQLLETLQLSPNRVFLLYCPDEVCVERLEIKRHEVLGRRFSGSENKALPFLKENNFKDFPFGRGSFRKRFDMFAVNLPEISSYFGSQMIYVDATQSIPNVTKFMENGVLKPPVVRFPDPNAGGGHH